MKFEPETGMDSPNPKIRLTPEQGVEKYGVNGYYLQEWGKKVLLKLLIGLTLFAYYGVKDIYFF